MSEFDKVAREIEQEKSRIAELDKRRLAACERKKALEYRLIEVAHGIKIGSVVRVKRTGDLFKIAKFDTVHVPNNLKAGYLPLLHGHKQKKDGGWAQNVQMLPSHTTRDIELVE